MKKEIKWIAGNGRHVVVTIELEDLLLGRCRLNVNATANGVTMGGGEPVRISHPVAAAVIGNLGLNAENFARVSTAIAECKATPMWAAKIALEKAVEDCDRSHDEIVKVMSR